MLQRSLAWRSLCLLLLVAPVRAQFSSLTATDDGNQLYFTSKLLLRGAKSTSQGPETRLYRSASDGVTLSAERGPLAPTGSFSSGDGVVSPAVSGDGTLVAFTFNDVCLSPPACTESVNEAELRGSQTLDLGPGLVQLSRNGRWALVANQVSGANYTANPPTLTTTYTTTLIDLTTGQRASISSQPAPGLISNQNIHTLASDGSVLIAASSSPQTDAAGAGFSIWKQGTATPVQLPAGVTPFALSDDAGTIVYYVYPQGPGALYQLGAFNRASGKSSIVFQAKAHQELPKFLAMDNTGRRVLYTVWTTSASGPAWLWDASTGATTAVPLDTNEFATDGALTGPGDYAFIATTRFRILKFAPATGTPTSLFPAPPNCDDPGPLGGGSMSRLRCSFSASLDALQGNVLFNQKPMPVLAADAAGIAVQIPWEWDTFFRLNTLSLNLPNDSPFQPNQPLSVWDGAPAMVPADPGESALFGIKIVKGDWSGLVTAGPAPGDIVYIYMTGLGPVKTAETTGVPSSLAAVNPIQWSLSCQFLPQAHPAQLLFAGMAPGLVGVYQTAFRIAADAGTAPITSLTCTLASPVASVTFGPGTPAVGMPGSGFFVVSPLRREGALDRPR